MERALAMKEVIKGYESMSGQMVNFNESLIYFSINTSEEDNVQIGS